MNPAAFYAFITKILLCEKGFEDRFLQEISFSQDEQQHFRIKGKQLAAETEMDAKSACFVIDLFV